MSKQRQRILDCACELYLAEGLEGFSMRRLAGRVGVTAPALYRHYENKEAVLIDVVAEGYRSLTQYLSRALESDTAEGRFLAAVEGYLDFALEQPRLYQVLYASRDVLGLDRLPDEAAARAAAIGRFWDDRVREAMDAGMLGGGEPCDVGRTLWAHAHGLVAIYLRGMLEEVNEEEFRKLFWSSSRRILRGLASEQYRKTIDEKEEGGR